MPRGGKEAMSYQSPPDYEADTAARNPPGWYLDPIGLQSLRWWDGAQWARQTQPLLGSTWERPCPYPDAIASGYGAVRQPGAGRHRQQDGPQSGTGYAPGLAPEPFPPVSTQPQPDPGRPQDPQGSPDQQSRVPGPPSPVLAACLSAHRTMINGSAPWAAWLSRSVTDPVSLTVAKPFRTLRFSAPMGVCSPWASLRPRWTAASRRRSGDAIRRRWRPPLRPPPPGSPRTR